MSTDNHVYTEEDISRMHITVEKQPEVPDMPGVVYATKMFMHCFIDMIARSQGMSTQWSDIKKGSANA